VWGKNGRQQIKEEAKRDSALRDPAPRKLARENSG
jgi:hypothetical protein